MSRGWEREWGWGSGGGGCWWAGGWGRGKNAYGLVSLGVCKFLSIICNFFQCMGKIMGKIFCVEFQRVPLKFHVKYLTHTFKDPIFIHCWMSESLRTCVHFSNAPSPMHVHDWSICSDGPFQGDMYQICLHLLSLMWIFFFIEPVWYFS